MAKTWIECFQEAKIIADAGRQPCKSWVTGLWPDFEENVTDWLIFEGRKLETL